MKALQRSYVKLHKYSQVNLPPICSPVSGSHWCSQGSRRRRPHSSLTQGPLAFCWWYNKIWAGFSQSEASSWLPCSRMNLDPDDSKVQWIKQRHMKPDTGFITQTSGCPAITNGFAACGISMVFCFLMYNKYIKIKILISISIQTCLVEPLMSHASILLYFEEKVYR